MLGSKSKHFPSALHSTWSGALALLCHRSIRFPRNTEQLRHSIQSVSHSSFHKTQVSESSQSIHSPEQFKDDIAECVWKEVQLRSSFRILLVKWSLLNFIQSRWQKSKHLWYHLKEHHGDSMGRKSWSFICFLHGDIFIGKFPCCLLKTSTHL